MLLLPLSNLVGWKQHYSRCEASLVAATGGIELRPRAIGAERGYLDVLGAKPCVEQQLAIRKREIDVEFFGVGVGEQWNIVARIAEEGGHVFTDFKSVGTNARGEASD